MAEYTQQQLLDLVNSSQVNPGNDRVRQITQRIVSDLFRAIDDLDIKPDEFWAGVDWLARLGGSGQLGLITAGLGFDRLIDIREEEADEAAGRAAGTPRAIEGPLYIAGAPLSDGEARLDEDPAAGTVLVMEGQVRDVDGNPVAGALVDVWHANELGRYSQLHPAGLRDSAEQPHVRTVRGAGPPWQPAGPHPLPGGGRRAAHLDHAGQHPGRHLPGR
jgi:catechol 1,2-dioxygenase